MRVYRFDDFYRTLLQFRIGPIKGFLLKLLPLVRRNVKLPIRILISVLKCVCVLFKASAKRASNKERFGDFIDRIDALKQFLTHVVCFVCLVCFWSHTEWISQVFMNRLFHCDLKCDTAHLSHVFIKVSGVDAVCLVRVFVFRRVDSCRLCCGLCTEPQTQGAALGLKMD